MNTKVCPKCSTEHSNKGMFCSRSCANSRNHTTDTKERISGSLRGRPGHCKNTGVLRALRVDTKCAVCGNSFIHKASINRKYCSAICRHSDAGGYREGSGRSISGYYNGVFCGSTYELIWVIYQIDHNISFQRFPRMLSYNDRNYMPDFLVGNHIVEIKGFESEESVAIKTAVANANGFDVVVLRRDQLSKEFEYVARKYHTVKFYELYDNYTPNYQYDCACCGTQVARRYKSKTSTVYCSRKCAMRGNRESKIKHQKE